MDDDFTRRVRAALETMPLASTEDKMVAQVDEIERALRECDHPYASHKNAWGAGFAWCNMCGAVRFERDGRWMHPHRRSAIARGLVRAH
jgi:hypothetical protein